MKIQSPYIINNKYPLPARKPPEINFQGIKPVAATPMYSNDTFLKKLTAKGIVALYKWLEGYTNSADKDLQKLLKRNDISFKTILLYIYSGALHFQELLNKKSLDEIRAEEKKSLLKKVIQCDMETFDLNRYIFPGVLPLRILPQKTAQKLYKAFPLLPHNEEEYSEFVKNLVDSIGINSNKLSQQEIARFNHTLSDLTNSLTKYSDEEFAKLDVTKIPETKEILNFIPELKSTVGRKQHGTHEFDVFKHSLKVLKKIGEDKNFQKLNTSDKKIMMMAALLHDITKKEGIIDESHPFDSSLDAFFIAKRFNLTQDEEMKLYTLIKNHEWLKYINTPSKDKHNYRMMNIAWEFIKDNLFEMSLIFTHADLKSVKKDDSFHDSISGKHHPKLNGRIRSYGEIADIYAVQLRNKIASLQETQPLLPMTQFPKASKIRQAVTQINSDGSTNIKGVYIDKDGLVVIKFNEVEEWEKIGFPKGSTTKGVRINLNNNDSVETGNIKFLAHGLINANQLARFYAFQLPDSTALLSVSYAERPESKYRFFRPQGLLGITDTFNILGGGVNDAGSGFKKNLKRFRYQLEYTGRKCWRPYISKRLSNALGFNANEYRQFVLENQNKAFADIFPEETRNIIIESLGCMQSNKRRCAREYNEFYATKFKPMSPYVYNISDSSIGNPIDFLNRRTINKNEKVYYSEPQSVSERTSFLRKYALLHDLPFTVFGN